MSHCKMKTSGCSNADRLSNLPRNLLDTILMLLPIKDAVSTSILSRDWRDRWTVMPQLIFNKRCNPLPWRDPFVHHLLHVSIVHQVLLNHKGPIRKFQCSLFVESCPDIDRWIVFLYNHGIQEFILHCLDGELYKVPSRLFSCQDLRYLELTDCISKPTSAFSYLANLKTLVLRRITINNETLKRLLSKCKFLEKLRLTDFEGLSNLEILAPNLKWIYIIGSFRGLPLDTPLLASARLDLLDSLEEEEDEYEEEDEVTESCVCNLIRVLGRLQYIQKLELKNWCLQAT